MVKMRVASIGLGLASSCSRNQVGGCRNGVDGILGGIHLDEIEDGGNGTELAKTIDDTGGVVQRETGHDTLTLQSDEADDFLAPSPDMRLWMRASHESMTFWGQRGVGTDATIHHVLGITRIGHGRETPCRDWRNRPR